MRLLTAGEVAHILQVSKARVYELARDRSLPSITLGQRQVRFDEVALQEWLQRATSTPLSLEGGVA